MRHDFDWPRTKAELADLVESMMGWQAFDKRFAWDVDDFENGPFEDADLEAWRQRILREIWHLQFPSKGDAADKIAGDRARAIVEELRKSEQCSK